MSVQPVCTCMSKTLADKGLRQLKKKVRCRNLAVELVLPWYACWLLKAAIVHR
jgi:hypothetical protein